MVPIAKRSILVLRLSIYLQIYKLKPIVWYSQGGNVVNAAFLFFETSKLWALIMYFVE